MDLMDVPLPADRREVLVVAGSGGNGGGGICAARHLSHHGYSVSLLVSRPEALREIPAQAYQRIGAFRPFSGQYGIKLHTP